MKKKPTKTKNAAKISPLPSAQWLSQSTRAATNRLNISIGSGSPPNLDILFDGNVVTDPQPQPPPQPVEVWIGENISLQIKITPDGWQVDSAIWTVPGDKVAGYDPSKESKQKTPFEPNSLKLPFLNYYWVSSGKQLVTAQVNISKDGEKVVLNAKATFDVKRPQIKFRGPSVKSIFVQVPPLESGILPGTIDGLVRLTRDGDPTKGSVAWAQTVKSDWLALGIQAIGNIVRQFRLAALKWGWIMRFHCLRWSRACSRTYLVSGSYGRYIGCLVSRSRPAHG